MDAKPLWGIGLFLSLIPLSLIVYGARMIKRKSGSFPGEGDTLRGKTGAAMQSLLNSEHYSGNTAVEMGKVYIILGILMLVGCILGVWALANLK